MRSPTPLIAAGRFAPRRHRLSLVLIALLAAGAALLDLLDRAFGALLAPYVAPASRAGSAGRAPGEGPA